MGQIKGENKSSSNCIETKIIELASALKIDLSQYLNKGIFELNSFIETVRTIAPNLAEEVSSTFSSEKEKTIPQIL